MKRIIIAKAILLALIIVSTVSVQPAQAYIDPSTGGQLFQLLAVIFTFFSAMLLFFSSYIRMGFARIKRFTRSLFGRNSQEQTIDEVESEDAQQVSDPGLEPGA